MPSYTLHYFNHRGRAEICRMLFAAAGVQYNDRRIEYSEWNNMRSRFHGKNNMDMARVDYISDCFYDIMDDYMRMYQDNNGRMMFQRSNSMNISSERRMRFQETCRRILPFMERTLEMRNGGNQFFMGDHILTEQVGTINPATKSSTSKSSTKSTYKPKINNSYEAVADDDDDKNNNNNNSNNNKYIFPEQFHLRQRVELRFET
ncbi:S-crystallin 3-like [Octopus vulgaris]|uniref:S-crystallin 3-like n=1 Tax=Octopus vulgaris TaxID=6645 RepID=A0AA36AVN4_OCTVU|nr:S-crystallin 3-like [Octopus vulgaris]